MNKSRIKSSEYDPQFRASGSQVPGEASAGAADLKKKSSRIGHGTKPKKNRQPYPVSGVDRGDLIGALASSVEEDAVPELKPKRSARRGHAHPGMRRKRSSRPDSPPSRPDSPQATGQPRTTPKRKQKKIHTGLSDPPANHSCSNAQRAGKASADAEKEENMLMGENPHKILRPSRVRGDVTIYTAEGGEPASLTDSTNKHDTEVEGEESTVVGTYLDGILFIGRSIPPASHSGSKSEESTWTQQKKILVDDYQEQGTRQLQDLLDLDLDTALDQIASYTMKLRRGPPDDDNFWDEYDESQLDEVYQRLALHRIKDRELLFTGKELDVAQLKDKYQLEIRQAEGYFESYEKDLEWYFDPELCQRASLNDYQRLVIHEDVSYANWGLYRSTYHTYEGDEEYVRYWDEMTNAIKWIANKVGLDRRQWQKYECTAYLQALKIATGYNIFRDTVIAGFNEYILNLQSRFDARKDYDGVYLEIWKRVAKDKMDFNTALRQIYEQNMFPYRNYAIKRAMENHPFNFKASIKDNYDAYVACIDGKTSEDEASRLIKEAVNKMVPKGKKGYLDYARKKMEIAARIGLFFKIDNSQSNNMYDGWVEQVPKGKKGYLDYARKKMEIAARIGLFYKKSS